MLAVTGVVVLLVVMRTLCRLQNVTLWWSMGHWAHQPADSRTEPHNAQCPRSARQSYQFKGNGRWGVSEGMMCYSKAVPLQVVAFLTFCGLVGAWSHLVEVRRKGGFRGGVKGPHTQWRLLLSTTGASSIAPAAPQDCRHACLGLSLRWQLVACRWALVGWVASRARGHATPIGRRVAAAGEC